MGRAGCLLWQKMGSSLGCQHPKFMGPSSWELTLSITSDLFKRQSGPRKSEHAAPQCVLTCPHGDSHTVNT